MIYESLTTLFVYGRQLNINIRYRYLSIIFDAMDQQKCRFPYVQGQPSWSKGKDRLASQVSSFIVHGHGTYGILMDEPMEKDGNFWTTCLLEIIKDVKERDYADGAKFPEVLYVQSDNASDNKNLCTMGIMELLRDTGVFRKVKFCFLPVGHTHEDVDGSFGALSRRLVHNKVRCDLKPGEVESADALVLDDVFRIWKSGWNGLRCLKVAQVLFFMKVDHSLKSSSGKTYNLLQCFCVRTSSIIKVG